MPRIQSTQAGPSRNDNVYDPDQDPEQRRGIRRGYREVQRDMDNSENPQQMLDSVEKMNRLFEQVRAPSDAVIDSDLLVKASKESAKLARAMRSGNSAFDVDDFVGRLITFMGGRAGIEPGDDDEEYNDDDTDATPLAWEKIGWKALAKSHRAPAMDFMLGPLFIEQKTRQATKRSKLEKHKEDQRKPQEITEEDITRSENETTKNVANVENILQATGKVNLFRFIVNPNDFGQSVENLFYLSFIIRDARCALEFVKGEPMIMSCLEPDADDYEGGLAKRQLVMELDMATWRRAIEVFHITEPIIPQRPKAQTRIGNKWYG